MENVKFDLSIIIVNYNGKTWLSKLLPGLSTYYLQKTKYNVEVIVVDNGSADDSVHFINSFDWIKLIESGQNNGYAYGNNIALKNNEARYIMLLNSDTEFLVTDSDLDQLIDYLDQNATTGVISPRIELSDGHLDQACHRGEPTPWAAFTYFVGLEKLFPKIRIFTQYHLCCKNMNKIHEIDACSGAAMIVRNSALTKVGLLDERFFMYAEDIDWCHRFRSSGFKIIFYPNVKVIHHKHKSGIQNMDSEAKFKTQAYFYKTMLQYYDKYYREKYPELFRLFLKFLIGFQLKNKRISSLH
jgi:GT2 family glycosyltransferase